MLLVVPLIEMLTCTIILFGILFGFSRGLSNVTFEGHSGDVSDMTLLDVLEALDYRCERGIFVRKLCMGICHYPFGLGISCIIQNITAIVVIAAVSLQGSIAILLSWLRCAQFPVLQTKLEVGAFQADSSFVSSAPSLPAE